MFHSHELMWGKLADSASQYENEILGTDHGLQWEWFLRKLDMSRIRLTLSDFPVWDSVKPKSETNDLDAASSDIPFFQDILKSNEDERYSPGFLLTLILDVWSGL